jgi:hypothetical protein
VYQLPVPEITLREWDASTLEDLPPPSLPFYISGTPDISMHPISWISSDRPLCADNFYTDSRENNAQSPPPTAPSLSRLKGKRREHDGNADVVGSVPTLKHNRFCPMSSPTRTEEVLPVTCHLIFDSEQEHRMAGASLTSWNYSELTTKAANLEPGMSAAPVRAVIPSNNCMMHWPLDYPSPAGVIPRDQLSSPLPLSHDIEYSSPSWSLVSLTETPSHSPALDYASYNPHLSCPMEEPVARYKSPEILDYASDSPSDSSDSTTFSPYGWVDSEPSSPDVFITLQHDAPPFPAIDSSGVPFLGDSPSNAYANVAGKSLLEGSQLNFKTTEPIPTYHKRKRLFVAEEDEYGEGARKQRRTEQ